MDYFDYFQRMTGSLLKDAIIVLAGRGQYNSREIIRTIQEQKARVVYVSDQGTETADKHVPSFLEENEVGKIIKDIISEYGNISVLITNFFNGKIGEFEDIGIADMEMLWENNVKKTFIINNSVAPYFKAQGYGKIINIVSASGKRAYLGACPAECASAAAVIGLTKGYAEQLAPYNVTANCLAPGLIDGEKALDGKSFAEVQQALPIKWQPVQKFGSCQDIGYAAAFLSSYFADYITGYTMDVNGGFIMD